MSELNTRKSRAMKVYAACAVVLAVMCMVNVPFWWFIAVGVVVIICGFAVMRDAVRNGRRHFGMCFFMITLLAVCGLILLRAWIDEGAG